MVWPQKGKGEPEKVPVKALRKAEGNRVQRLRETWEDVGELGRLWLWHSQGVPGYLLCEYGPRGVNQSTPVFQETPKTPGKDGGVTSHHKSPPSIAPRGHFPVYRLSLPTNSPAGPPSTPVLFLQ